MGTSAIHRPLFRSLPPVGAPVPLFGIFAAVRDAMHVSSSKSAATDDLQYQLRELTGLSHWIFTNSGRSALSIILMLMKKLHPDRDEVIIPAYTSFSVPAAVVRAGLRVQLCDVELETLGIAPKYLESTFTPKTLCVVPHHLFGVSSQIKAVSEISRDHGIPVIEDAAQAMGGRYMGQPLGSLGEAGIFSLSRGKTLPAADGGMIGTNDEKLAHQCRQMLDHLGSPQRPARSFGIDGALKAALMGLFIRPSLYWLPASLQFLKLGSSIYDPDFEIARMSRFQESLAARLLPGLEQLLTIRQKNSARLHRALSEFRDLYIVGPAIEGATGGGLRLPILVKDPIRRKRMLRELQQEGLGVTGGYPAPLSDISELRSNLVSPNSEYPVARHISQQLVTLPTHPYVTEDDMKRMVEVIRRCTHKQL